MKLIQFQLACISIALFVITYQLYCIHKIMTFSEANDNMNYFERMPDVQINESGQLEDFNK